MIYNINGTVDGETVIEASIKLDNIVGVQIMPVSPDEDQWQIVVMLEKGGQIVMLVPEKCCRDFQEEWVKYYTEYLCMDALVRPSAEKDIN